MSATVAQAPGRVNLIGEHTDYNGGLVLPVALPQVTTVRLTPSPDDRVHVNSTAQDDPVSVSLDALADDSLPQWARYVTGTLWALGEAGLAIAPWSLEVDSDVPLGGGLSSSAALECATAVAVAAELGLELDDALRGRLGEACIRAETEVVGAPTGGMDQAASLFCRAGHALLLDFDRGGREQVPLHLGTGAESRVLLVTDTRVSHELTDGGYGSRRDDCERAAQLLGVDTLRHATLEDLARIDDPDPQVQDRLRRRVRHIVTETARVTRTVDALAAGDWAGIGELFAASHASMRDDFEISTPELDLSVDAAVAAGADAARMTGGGFGGSTVAIVPRERLEAVKAAVDAAFAERGYSAPAHLEVVPSDGARALT